MANIALNILTGIVIAAVSSWITVQLSFRRFRTEKWWEKKADAYSKVIEALHNLKIVASHLLEAEIQGRELPEDRKDEFRRRLRASRDEILRAMDVGAFLLSNEALVRLEQYQKDTEEASKQKSWFDHLDEAGAAAGRCLNDIITIAKTDLKAK